MNTATSGHMVTDGRGFPMISLGFGLPGVCPFELQPEGWLRVRKLEAQGPSNFNF